MFNECKKNVYYVSITLMIVFLSACTTTGKIKTAEDYFTIGEAFYEQKEYEQAIVELNQAILINSTYAEAYLLRGRSFAGMEDYDSAMQDYNMVLKINPDYIDAYLSIAGAYLAQERYDMAIAVYDKALSIDPENAEIYRSRSFLFWQMRMIDYALDDIKTAILLAPNDTSSHSILVLYYSNLGYIQLALETAKIAFAIDPNMNNTILVFLSYMYSNDISGLVLFSREAIDNNIGDIGFLYYVLAVAYVMQQGNDAAKELIMDAIQNIPDNEKLYFTLAFLLMIDLTEDELDTDLFNESLIAVDRSIAINSEFSQGYTLKGVLYEITGDSNTAIEYFSIAIMLEPSARAYKNRGGTYFRLDDFENAKNDFLKAILYDRNFAETYYGLGRVMAEMGNHEDAIRYYELAISNGFRAAYVYKHIAIAYEKMGNDLSQYYYREAASIDPDYEILKDGIRVEAGFEF